MFQKNFILMMKKSGQEGKRTDHFCSTSSLVRPPLNLKKILVYLPRLLIFTLQYLKMAVDSVGYAILQTRPQL